MRRIALSFWVAVGLAAFSVASVSANTSNDMTSRASSIAELFGLSLNDLSLARLEKQLSSMGLRSYPSYKEGVVSYSLGPEGIFGVTNATIYSNASGYVSQALLSGVIESNEKRKALGELLEKKYGAPSEGFLNKGIGRSTWLFKDGTMIELHNSTFDVSIMYVDEHPREEMRSGQIDVEALSRKK